MDDRLSQLLARQRELQLKIAGADPGDLEGDERADFFRTMAYAMDDETHEAGNELGWKPWATSRHINRQAYLKELIDAFHFWLNLWLLGGGTPDEWFDMYWAKSEVNLQRQVEGYDGVKGKCTFCHRDLAEIVNPKEIVAIPPNFQFCNKHCHQLYIVRRRNG